jgi:hypothetical protein
MGGDLSPRLGLSWSGWLPESVVRSAWTSTGLEASGFGLWALGLSKINE